MKIARYIKILALMMTLGSVGFHAEAQRLSMVVNAALVEDVELTTDNIFNYQIVSNESVPKRVKVTGTVIFKRSNLRFSYSYNKTIHPGLNQISKDEVTSPIWNFSSQALRELFFDYSKLPQGAYEYCIKVSHDKTLSEERLDDPVMECVYNINQDIFLLSLITPEDKAELYERYPMFSWVVNHPLAGQLTYRLRLVELKTGQNNAIAITRNNAYYKEKNILSTSQLYPAYARQLQVEQPYVWTVDAYYKGVLIGGAEPWRFKIIEDSLQKKKDNKAIPYLDIRHEKIKGNVIAVGELKIRYDLREYKSDSLQLVLKRGEKEIKLKQNVLVARKGDNRYEIDFTRSPRLKHKKTYDLYITNEDGEKFVVTFKYENPELL